MSSRILLIDDDTDLCHLLIRYLENEHFVVEVTHDGHQGVALARKEAYDLIILDVMLPGLDGFLVLEEVRKISAVPVLMLTAKTESTDKVNGLRAGADDYLTKPFDVEELMARVFSLIRRYTTLNGQSQSSGSRLSFEGLVIDRDTRIVHVRDEPIELHAKEFNILYYLASNPGTILTKQQIYEEVWQEPYAYDDNNIMGYISKLRKYIEADPNQPMYIQTVKGVGYRFNREV